MDNVKKAFELFKKSEYEKSLYEYLKELIKDSDLEEDFSLTALFSSDELISKTSLVLMNINDYYRSNYYMKSLIILGISQCLNNIASKRFSPNNIRLLRNSSNLQKISLGYFRTGVKILMQCNFKVDYSLLNQINYTLSLLETNLGMMISRDLNMDKTSKIESFRIIELGLSRLNQLIELDPCKKYWLAKSYILSYIGDETKAKEFVDMAMNADVSEVNLSNIHLTKYREMYEGTSQSIILYSKKEE